MPTIIPTWRSRAEMVSDFGKDRVCGEVGVFRGTFSRRILQANPRELVLIDRWRKQSGDYEVDCTNNEDLDAACRVVQEQFGSLPNVRIVKDWSVVAAEAYPPDYFDWVYLDADHTWKGITQDLYVGGRRSNQAAGYAGMISGFRGTSTSVPWWRRGQR